MSFLFPLPQYLERHHLHPRGDDDPDYPPKLPSDLLASTGSRRESREKKEPRHAAARLILDCTCPSISCRSEELARAQYVLIPLVGASLARLVDARKAGKEKPSTVAYLRPPSSCLPPTSAIHASSSACQSIPPLSLIASHRSVPILQIGSDQITSTPTQAESLAPTHARNSLSEQASP